ncbi:MAG: PadR family transcriptional regulator, partial [Gaiellaceae bacterium]
MVRPARTEPSLTEWAALGILCERPAHGWDVARLFGPEAEVGRVWAVSRALVYRALGVLRELEFVVPRGSEPSSRGPHRVLLAPTPRGRQALRRWLARPTGHVRDLRSELLVKLLLLHRAGRDSRPLLGAQLALLQSGEHALAALVRETDGFDRTVAVWRLTTARAARAFVEALLDERSGEPVNYEAIGYVSAAHTSLDGMPLQPGADRTG